jgi:hypothetical protein
VFTGGESPGSIRNQIGRSLNEIRECVSREDPLALANHVRFMVALAAPHLREKEPAVREKLKLPRMAPGKMDDAEAVALYEACMGVLEELLPILAEAGLYAFVTADEGDASDLALSADAEAVAGAVAP